MRLIFLFSLYMGFTSNIGAQTDCWPIIKRVEQKIKEKYLEEALKHLQDAELCDYKFDEKLRNKRQALQKEIFDAVQKQKEAAIEERNKAKRYLGEKSKLLSYFDWKFGVDIAKKDGKYGLIDSLGNEVNDNFIYEYIGNFDDNGISIASVDNRKVLLSHTGNELSNKHKFLKKSSDKRFLADIGGYIVQSFIDTPIVANYQFIGVPICLSGELELRNCSEKVIFRVKKNDKWGFLNLDNSDFIYPKFLDAFDYSEKLAAVKDSNGWFYIDVNEKKQFNEYFDMAMSFKNDTATVLIDTSFYHLLKNGEKVEIEDSDFPTLRLGTCDNDSKPDDMGEFLSLFHSILPYRIQEIKKFKDEGVGAWREIKPISGDLIKIFQRQLNRLGFLKNQFNEGVFDYYTQSSIRFFQEFVRTNFQENGIGIPDGAIGRATKINLLQKRIYKNYYINRFPKSGESEKWFSILKKANGIYEKKKISSDLNYANSEWNLDKKFPHLIGIRRPEDGQLNNDIFVLLINDFVYKFWGSTKPNPNSKYINSMGQAYLIEGQHNYSISFHKISDQRKVYRAFRPSRQVSIFRDRNKNDKLDSIDKEKGIEYSDNINIHWSGIGSINFSAGSQVISGASYIDNFQKLVDCREYAAVSYGDLGLKTKGAYNVLIDLVTIYSDQGISTPIYYTLINESILEDEPEFNKKYMSDLLEELKSGLKSD